MMDTESSSNTALVGVSGVRFKKWEPTKNVFEENGLGELVGKFQTADRAATTPRSDADDDTTGGDARGRKGGRKMTKTYHEYVRHLPGELEPKELPNTNLARFVREEYAGELVALQDAEVLQVEPLRGSEMRAAFTLTPGAFQKPDVLLPVKKKKKRKKKGASTRKRKRESDGEEAEHKRQKVQERT
eukprot:TRINITY_DN10595_c0_g1_i1.p1 TRINITY_DN10595_c0_g1~~TRINITY_DN10595_c0_g1_i1.p1  ORF type:complete len:187 (-),score=48.55 TRINITY_DN10595_c0_g1_i1:68-628(-)